MSKREFFVGYLPMSRSQRRGVITLAAVIAILALGTGGWLASSQQSAGTGQWDPTSAQASRGLLRLDPYPVLHMEDGRSALIVRAGKASAAPILREFDGDHIAIRGAPIERGGWMMLEVSDAATVSRLDTPSRATVPAASPGETVKLAGEIVDSKCFLGVMKPGSGKVHRACAAMCLTGGLPPMLVVTDDAGDRYGYMLTTADGGSASKALVPHVAVPVTVTGSLERRGELSYVRVSGVERLATTAWR